jgi:hypothetical protein
MIWSRRARRGLLIVGVALAGALPASAHGVVLYDQTDFAGVSAVTSTDYNPPNDSLDTQIADDFTVPPGQSWQISQLDVKGILDGAPPPTMNVFLYANSGTVPGAELFRQANISATNAPDYSIPLTGAAALPPGTYWVSAQQAGGSLIFGQFSDWSWRSRTVQAGNPAVFRNPGNGFTTGCTDWGTLTSCNSPLVGPDVLFRLSGTVVTPPSNAFSFGKLKRNKRKGTATLTVIVPGPGTLMLRGKGLVKQRPAGASGAARAVAKAVSAAGKVKLRIKSKGRKQRKLNRTGKVKVKANVTYTPTGGDPSTKTKRIKLIKRL